MELTGSEYLDSYIQMIDQEDSEKKTKEYERQLKKEQELKEQEEEEFELDLLLEESPAVEAIRKNYGDDVAKEYVKDTLKKVNIDEKLNEAVEFYKSKGYNPQIIAAVLGNAIQESNLNHTTIHDNNTGYGLFGHRLDRKDALLNYIKGKDNEFTAQLDFAMMDLISNYSSTYQKMLNANSAKEAAIIFSKEYERPHKLFAKNNQRAYNAENIMGNYFKGQTGYKIAQPGLMNTYQALGLPKDLNFDPNKLQWKDAYANSIPYSQSKGENAIDSNLFKNSNIPYSRSTKSNVPVIDPTTATINAVDSKIANIINTVQGAVDFTKDLKSIAGNSLSTVASLTQAILDKPEKRDLDLEEGYQKLNTNNYYTRNDS